MWWLAPEYAPRVVPCMGRHEIESLAWAHRATSTASATLLVMQLLKTHSINMRTIQQVGR